MLYKYIKNLVTCQETGIIFIREQWLLFGVVVRERLTQVK